MGASPKTTNFLKECMADALLQLMKENQYSKITIKDISINVNIKMYIFDHLKMYRFAYSSSGFMYSRNRYDLPVILITCA